MTLLDCATQVNSLLAIPTTIVFMSVAVILTFKTRFVQIRALHRFWKILGSQYRTKKYNTADISDKKLKTISPIQALFTAMTTTIGMGNIVGPTMAIAVGGPGALFWLIVYILLSMVVKFVEVTFSVYSRSVTKTGEIIGGPAQYLKIISPKLASWYAISTMFLFVGWCGLQTNTLASIYSRENIPLWLTGILASVLVLVVVLGGIKRIGSMASKIIPFVFVLYVSYTLVILLKDPVLLSKSINLVFTHIFSPCAALGGFLGATVFVALKEGVYKSVFITESGLGTSAIAHAFSDIDKPSDQGILAMFSGFANIFLCTLSGLLAITTKTWTNATFSSALVYDAFSQNSQFFGKFILLLSVTIFVIITIVGNTFNGGQSFASIWGYKFIKLYYIFAALVTFAGAMCDVPLIWAIMDIILALVALPNVISILILAIKYPKIIKV